MSETSEELKPGSEIARQNGCTCPRMDNNNGEGVPFQGATAFWMTDDCPIHGFEDPTHD